MRRARKPKPPRKLAYTLIEPETASSKPMYKLLETLVEKHHDGLEDARIALAWNTSWKADADGRVKLGKCKIAGALDRALAPWDLIVILNQEFWTSPEVDDKQRSALLDHELCHAERALDAKGEPRVDAGGRALYRIRRHDIEEFGCIVERYGLWKQDLERFAAAIRRGQATLEFKEEPKPKTGDAGARPTSH